LSAIPTLTEFEERRNATSRSKLLRSANCCSLIKGTGNYEGVKGKRTWDSYSLAPPHTVHWRIYIIAAILASAALFFTQRLDAKIYLWIDENGVKHYSNTPPANAGNVKAVFDEANE